MEQRRLTRQFANLVALEDIAVAQAIQRRCAYGQVSAIESLPRRQSFNTHSRARVDGTEAG